MRLAINKRGHGGYCVMQGSWFSKVLLFETLWAVPGMMRQGRGWALRGTGPPLAGNVGRGWAFALARDGENRVFTFLRSLWPGPAAAGWFSGGWEWGLGCGGSGRLLCFRGMMRRGRGWVLRGPSRGRWVRCRSDVARDGCSGVGARQAGMVIGSCRGDAAVPNHLQSDQRRRVVQAPQGSAIAGARSVPGASF